MSATCVPGYVLRGDRCLSNPGDPVFPHFCPLNQRTSEPFSGGVPCAVRALCEKLAVLHHREFGKFRRLKGRH